MANIKRLTRRVGEMEDWIEKQGDGDTMANYNYLIKSVRQAGDMLRNEQQNHQNFRNLVFEWMNDRKHGDDWNDFVKEKEDAVQKQQAEEVSVQEETESSEETVETPEENWDELMDRVENGETIGVENEEGERAVMLPADDEFIKIHTELNNDAD